MVSRGVVSLVNDGKMLQLLQIGVLAGETVEGDEGAEHFQPYGFTSVPLIGAEAVVVFPNGDRGHPLVVATSDRRYRPTGSQPGEVTVYNNTGAKVTLTKDGDILVEPASGRQVFVQQGGAAEPLALKSDVQAIVDAHNGHTHVVAGVLAGSSSVTSATTADTASSPTGTTVLLGK